MSVLADILKEAPLSAVLQEKVKAVEFQRDEFKRELDDCRRLHQVLKDEHQRLVALHAEEIQFHRLVEFHRGKRTGGQWMAFCPKCHLPAGDATKGEGHWFAYCSAKCGWRVDLPLNLPGVVKELKSAST